MGNVQNNLKYRNNMKEENKEKIDNIAVGILNLVFGILGVLAIIGGVYNIIKSLFGSEFDWVGVFWGICLISIGVGIFRKD